MRFTVAVKNIIYNRAKGQCDKCGTHVPHGEGQVHHRQAGGMGGSKNNPVKGLPSNGLFLCSPCHTDIESNRTVALENGWLVAQRMDPAVEPVLLWSGLAWLDERGGVTYVRRAVGRNPAP